MGTVSIPLPQVPFTAADHAQLAGAVADGASRCAMIVDCATADALHCRVVAAALRSRMDCIDDLTAFGEYVDVHGSAPGGDGTSDGASHRAHAVAAALRELNGSILHATRLLEEGTRLRDIQREIVADIQGSLLRTERQVRGLARDTDALVQYVASIANAR